MILSDNFKTTRVEARFILNMDKKEVPLLELLSSLLIYTSKKYNTRKDFINKCKDLYDSTITSNIKEDGNRVSLDLSISFLDEKYSSNTLFEEAIEFLKEIIYNPNINEEAFDEESYNAVEINLLSDLETIIEDKSRYSNFSKFTATDTKAYLFVKSVVFSTFCTVPM